MHCAQHTQCIRRVHCKPRIQCIQCFVYVVQCIQRVVEDCRSRTFGLRREEAITWLSFGGMAGSMGMNMFYSIGCLHIHKGRERGMYIYIYSVYTFMIHASLSFHIYTHIYIYVCIWCNTHEPCKHTSYVPHFNMCLTFDVVSIS